MGSDSEFRDFIHFVDEHKLAPVVEAVFPLERFGDALQALESGQQFGKVCLTMSTPSAKL